MNQLLLFPEAGRHPDGFVYEAHTILAQAIREYRPDAVFGLFSGGHDSLCAVHVAATFPEFTAAVHINTGTGVRETREYVLRTAEAQGWPLIEMHPPPFTPAVEKRRPGIDYERLPTYEALVLHHGFPGPGGHQLIYTRLKERCLRKLVREHKRSPKGMVLLVGGMRAAESVRRMGNIEERSREGCRCWCAPLANWTDEDRHQYIEANRLPHSPVAQRLCRSGECNCGAFAKPGEIAELEHCYPETARWIHNLEAKARARGVHCVWGTRPPGGKKDKHARGQPELFSLCWSCGHK